MIQGTRPNRYPHLEITQTAATLGYHPVDDGWSS